MGPWLVVAVALAAGAADEVQAVQQALVQPWDDEDDVVMRMGPRSLTVEGLHEAVRPDARAFELVDRGAGQLRTGKRLRYAGAGVVLAGGLMASIGLATVAGTGVITPLFIGLLIAGGVMLGVAVTLATAGLILTWQADELLRRGTTAWNQAVFAGARGEGAAWVAAARGQWLGLCDGDPDAFCVGSQRLESDEAVARLLESRSQENAAAFREHASAITRGVVLQASGLALLLLGQVPLYLIPGPVTTAVVGACLLVGLILGFVGSYQTREGVRGAQRARAAYNFSVMNDAAKAARKADAERAPVESPAAAPQDAPPEKSPEPEPEAPTAPPPPPPVGPTRRPLRPQTSLDGPLPSLLLVTF